MARATVIVAANDGWSEVALAQNLGVDRMTIRKWLGKRS
jgi:transposase